MSSEKEQVLEFLANKSARASYYPFRPCGECPPSAGSSFKNCARCTFQRGPLTQQEREVRKVWAKFISELGENGKPTP